MSFKAVLLIDDKEINIVKYHLDFKQGANVTGRPSQKPLFKGIAITIETQKEINFVEWMIAKNLTKQITILLIPNILGGRTRKIRLFDTHLVNWHQNFSSTSNKPLSETLNINAGGFEDSFSSGIYSSSWRVTFPDESTEATVIEGSDPRIIHYHIEDMEGNELTKNEIDVGEEIIIVVESKDAVGQYFEFDLDDQKLDYEHNGRKLSNDILEVEITNDVERIPLKAILQEN